MTTPTTNADDGILAGLGLEDVPDHLPDGVYPAFVTDAKVITHKDATKGKSLVFTYKVNQPGSKLNGETIDEFKSINASDDNQKKKFLKMRLESLGVPSTRLSTFKPSDVVGLAVTVTVKTNGEYTNVSKVELRGEGSVLAASNAVGTVNPTGNSDDPSALADLL